MKLYLDMLNIFNKYIEYTTTPYRYFTTQVEEFLTNSNESLRKQLGLKK